MSHHVYYFWQDRTPLYVGVTGNLAQRLRQHSGRPGGRAGVATLIQFIAFEDEASAYAAEAEQIASLRPVFNTRHNPAHQSAWDAYDAEAFVPDRELTLLNAALGRIFKAAVA